MWDLVFHTLKVNVHNVLALRQALATFLVLVIIDDEQCRGGPGLSGELWDMSVLSIVSLEILDVIESIRLDVKFGMPHWAHVLDMSLNAS